MDNKNIYEHINWNNLDNEQINEKIKKLIALIPEDTKTIIDIGCGNGLITNILSQKYIVTGVDRSENALKQVQTEKILADSDKVPLPDNSFDMVFSSELLEHISETDFQNTIKEFKRLSKKYILITVPNSEKISKKFIQCPECKYIYNLSYHLRGLSENDFINLFPEYELVKSLTLGKKVRDYKLFIAALKHKLSPPVSWIPYLWISQDKRATMCPNCENKFTFHYKFSIISFMLDMFNILLSRKKPYWLCVLLVKK